MFTPPATLSSLSLFLLSFLFIIHVSLCIEEPPATTPTLPSFFGGNFVLTVPPSTEKVSEDQAPSFLQPSARTYGAIYVDYKNGKFRAELFQPYGTAKFSWPIDELTDSKHTNPYSAFSFLSLVALKKEQAATLFAFTQPDITEDVTCKVWGSTKSSYFPQELKIPPPDAPNSNTQFVEYTIKNGVHSEVWKFSFQFEKGTFDAKVYVSRFDRLPVFVEVSPTPWAPKIELSFFNMNEYPSLHVDSFYVPDDCGVEH